MIDISGSLGGRKGMKSAAQGDAVDQVGMNGLFQERCEGLLGA